MRRQMVESFQERAEPALGARTHGSPRYFQASEERITPRRNRTSFETGCPNQNDRYEVSRRDYVLQDKSATICAKITGERGSSTTHSPSASSGG